MGEEVASLNIDLLLHAFKDRNLDIYVKLIDAIAYASWLRSSVSAHRISRLSKSLTVYDVANIQHLARRLLLETLGFWNYHHKLPG